MSGLAVAGSGDADDANAYIERDSRKWMPVSAPVTLYNIRVSLFIRFEEADRLCDVLAALETQCVATCWS
jgi:hypothetical protein